MNPIYLLVSLVLLAAGCASTYEHSESQPIGAKLDRTKGVLISTPRDGVYGNIRYHTSGSMTASAIRAAFSRHASRVDVVDRCDDDNCLSKIDTGKYGYYVKPTIIHWEDRATEWSGRPDRIEIQIAIYDTATKRALATSSYTGTSKWATLGGDHPQDLLPEPTNQYVDRLYGAAPPAAARQDVPRPAKGEVQAVDARASAQDAGRAKRQGPVESAFPVGRGNFGQGSYVEHEEAPR